MKTKTIRKICIGAGSFTAIVAIALAFMFINFNTSYSAVMGDTNINIEKIRDRKLQRVPLGDAGLGSGNTTLQYIMIYPHQAVPATAYASNLSNASAFEYYDYINNELLQDTPFNTLFDIVIKIAVYSWHGYNTTSSQWEMGWINSTLTCITPSIGPDAAMLEQQIDSGGDWNYVHYYLNNGGSGYSISHGVSCNCTNYEFWAFF